MDSVCSTTVATKHQPPLSAANLGNAPTSEAAKLELLVAYQPLIRNITGNLLRKRNQRRPLTRDMQHELMDDASQAGAEAFLTAVRHFDPERNSSLGAFARKFVL